MDELITLERALNINFLKLSIKYLPYYSWATIIATIALITTLYFLIKQNSRLSEQNRELSKQTKDLKNSIIGSAIFEISNNHREITKLAIDDEFFGQCLHPGKDHNNLKSEYIYAMAINHAECVWMQKVLGNLTDEYWGGIKVSMRNMFQRENIKKEWESVKCTYDKNFQNFIGNIAGTSEKIEKQPA
jgi:hypothetical protein